jgi:hypothetical protein
MNISKPTSVVTTTQQTNAAAPITKVSDQPAAATTKQALVQPLAPSAAKPEPYVGKVIAAQIGRISMLNGTDPEAGGVAWTRKLSDTDKFDKVGVFFEAEAKLTLIDDADADAVKAKVLAAGDNGTIANLLPKGYTGLASTFTCKWDRPNSRSGADFHDVYGDDAQGNAAKHNSQIRERRIGDTPDGKFETKLPAADVQGSAVLGRIECAKSTGPTRRTKESLIKEAVGVVNEMNKRGLTTPDARAAFAATLPQEQRENPMVLLCVEIPAFDPNTYADRINVDDIRHQLVLVDGAGKDAFLVTLDYVTGTRIDGGKKGSFVEFEIERMDGSTTKGGLSELIEMTNVIAKALGLTKSPAPKNARAWSVTE